MRFATRLLLAPVLLLAMAATVPAQDFSNTAVFTFAPRPGPDEVKDANRDLSATENIALRPNTAAEVYLYAFNPAKVQKTYLVDVTAPPGTKLSAQAKVTIPAERWVRVRLPKPAAPAVPAPAAPLPTPPGANQPVPESLPPGSELLVADGRFSFTLRLLNEDKTEVLDADGKPYGRSVAVTVLQPADYIAAPSGTLTQSDNLAQVVVTVEPRVNEKKVPAFIGSADVRLSFPPQMLFRGAIVREGFYRRTLVSEAKGFTPVKLAGAVENPGTELRVNVGVDGFDRAFIYKPAPATSVDAGKLVRDSDRAIRVYPSAGYAINTATQPVSAFPVRVEADNAPRDAALELWVRRAGDGDDASLNEVIKLGGPREERAWLDTAGPLDQGFLVSNRSRDWQKPIDLSALRGRQEVVAVMTIKGATGQTQVKSEPLAVTIDATPPVGVTFGTLPAKHVKGKPLPVRASVADPETRVAKAVFFLGKPLDDGKLPPDAVLVDGKPVADKVGVWEAEIPLAPEKKGEAIIGVVFTNEVGLATTKTQRVELIDAPPPSGAIDGVILIGERPQPGVVVSLRAADGKEKATTTTSDKGTFKFENVPIGNYTVASARPDSSYGFAGSAPVQVELERRAKVAVTLTKQVK